MSYLKYSLFLKKKFGVKVQKVSIDAGFTCLIKMVLKELVIYILQ